MTQLSWVVGGRGLLGSGLRRAIGQRPGWELAPLGSLPWDDPTAFKAAARFAVRQLVDLAQSRGSAWSILWAAGAVVTSSPAEAFDREQSQFRNFLNAIRDEVSNADSTGSLFFASSGGAVYAGSASPPFNESTAPAPISRYGEFKLAMEAEVERLSVDMGLPVLIGRISNLYGPGQRLDKMQGLISHLALARFTNKPVFIFVPLETVRDYIYVDDCATLILDAVDRLASVASAGGPRRVTKIFGSGDGVSISTLLGYYRAITKAPPHVALGTTPATKHQAIDLRMRSVVWPDLDRRELTPVAAGFNATMADVLRMLQR